ncbi:hypothetical protein [Streptomyces prunicolor]|uniref:hypothetical protein n=1 Tax=Streptomyces prunicolor TaxID=67348 RepID=UPI0033F2889E
MIQHMNLVFGAEGLTVGEGAFLMACANHTDARGYVIASMQQLADESHMKERTARDNKQRLIKRGLLAAAERYHPKNGARIADMYRVNLDMLKQIQRNPRDYGPTVVEELTFATAEETRRSDPPADSAAPLADSAAPPADSAPTPPADSAPLLLPSSSPSPLSGVPPVPLASGTDEREMDASRDKTTSTPPAAAAVPGPRTTDEQKTADSVAMLTELPAELGKETVARLAPLAAAAFADGWTVETLRAQLNKRVDVSKIHTPGALAGLYERALKDLPAAPLAQSADGRERCPDHPGRYRRGCMDCALAVPA